MSDPRPYVVAQWISDSLQASEYAPLLSVIEGVLAVHLPSRSEEEIAEMADLMEAQVFASLGVVADELVRTGTEPSFALEGQPGTAYIKAQNLEAIASVNWLKEMPSDAFEHFCVAILSALGASARRVGGSGDGGVDFTATGLPICSSTLVALTPCRPTVIGQAKRYGSKMVSVVEVRESLGASMMRADEVKRQDERLGLFSPVVFAFWTTSDFNLPATQFAREAGMWALGGLALAQLALNLGVRMAEDESLPRLGKDRPIQRDSPNAVRTTLGRMGE